MRNIHSPPFNEETAKEKVQITEDAYNSKNLLPYLWLKAKITNGETKQVL